MDTKPLENFIIDLAMILAGSITNSDTAEGFTADQLGIIFFAALGAYAPMRKDYDANTDLTPIIQLGVATYGEALYATVAAQVQRDNERIEQLAETTAS